MSKITRNDQRSKSLIMICKNIFDGFIFVANVSFMDTRLTDPYTVERCRKTEVLRILSNALTRRKVSFWFYDVYSCCQLVFSRKSCFTHLCITYLIASCCLSIIRYILALST